MIGLAPAELPGLFYTPMINNGVAFVAAPYGFGPSSKAIAISSHLPRSIKRVFFGDGPSLDLARASHEFSICVKLDFNTKVDEVAAVLSRYRVVVFVNTTRFLAASSPKVDSLIFVDTLAWIRRPQLSALPTLSAYFAQRFFNHDFAADLESASCFCATGAIVPKSLAHSLYKRTPSEKSPIIHCGGLFSPAMRSGADTCFITHLCRVLNEIRLPVRIILPKHLHPQFAALATANISLIDCSPVDVRKHIEGSLFGLSTSGIEFTYETALLRVPILFLPPFNATQLLQLNYHRRAYNAYVPFLLNGETRRPISQTLDSDTRTLQEEGMSGMWSEQFAALTRYLKEALSGSFPDTLAALQHQQQQAFATVGSDGARTIASRIVSDLGY